MRSSKRNFWIVSAALLSVIIGLMPALIPADLANGIHASLGKNETIIWTTSFCALAVLFVLFTLKSNADKAPASGKIVNISKVKSGGDVKVNALGTDRLSAEKLDAQHNIDLSSSHGKDVNIRDLSSGNDTNITISNL